MRAPVAADRIEADRRAMERKLARLQERAKAVQRKEALRLRPAVEIKGGDVKPSGVNGAKSAASKSDVRRSTATAWQKRRPASADSQAMPISMRKALHRGSTKAVEAVEREFTPTVARPDFLSSTAPQPAPDERALRRLIAAAQSDGTARPESPPLSSTIGATGKSPSTCNSKEWSSDRALRDSNRHLSPQRQRNAGLVAGSPPWPLHRVAIAQAVAESLSLRDDGGHVLRSRSSSLAEYQQRHCAPPQYDISYLDDNDAQLEVSDGSWRRCLPKTLPSAQDAEALRRILRTGLANARYNHKHAENRVPGMEAESSCEQRSARSAENVLAKVFSELATVRPCSLSIAE